MFTKSCFFLLLSLVLLSGCASARMWGRPAVVPVGVVPPQIQTVGADGGMMMVQNITDAKRIGAIINCENSVKSLHIPTDIGMEFCTNCTIQNIWDPNVSKTWIPSAEIIEVPARSQLYYYRILPRLHPYHLAYDTFDPRDGVLYPSAFNLKVNFGSQPYRIGSLYADWDINWGCGDLQNFPGEMYRRGHW